MDRRSVIAGLGAGAGLLALGSCTGADDTNPGISEAPIQQDDQEELVCVDRSAMTSISRLGDKPLIYDIDERASSFPIEPNFLSQLESWQTDWLATSGLPAHDEVWTYGAYVQAANGACNSWHGAGRAFDISRLRLDGAPIVSCRQDLWETMTDQEQRTRLIKRYWALAASLHLHFAYVLTYLFDQAHRNHIHVDNGVSGSGMSRFNQRSGVQNHALQAICTYLWDIPVDLSGDWDDATRAATTQVIEQLGGTNDVTRDDNWALFLRGSVGRAA